jgi:hypothetical protein
VRAIPLPLATRHSLTRLPQVQGGVRARAEGRDALQVLADAARARHRVRQPRV